MIRIAICDDDTHWLESIKEDVSKWSSEYDIQVMIYIFDNGDQLLEHCRREHTDILLLDIMMPLLNGMDAAFEIREQDQHMKLRQSQIPSQSAWYRVIRIFICIGLNT